MLLRLAVSVLALCLLGSALSLSGGREDVPTILADTAATVY